MHDWELNFFIAKKNLKKHCPETALRYLKKALILCPENKIKEASKLMFFIGITLKKLGLCDHAIKTWLAANRLNKSSYSTKMIKRFINEYGMEKQSSTFLDDMNAFFSIQLSRYLNLKKSKRISTDAELDMIHDLIQEAWVELLKSGKLEDKTNFEKEQIFFNTFIVFPFINTPINLKEPLIKVNFIGKCRILSINRCPCGSGLNYGMCCGRKKSKIDLINGII